MESRDSQRVLFLDRVWSEARLISGDEAAGVGLLSDGSGNLFGPVNVRAA